MEAIDINAITKLFGILITLVHFLAFFILYRDVVRINRVFNTPTAKVIGTFVFIYLLFLLFIFVFFVIVE